MDTRVMVVGLGPIGTAIARQVASRAGFRVVAAVDSDPAKAGQPLAKVVALRATSRVRIEADVQAAIARARPHVALLCTASSLRRVAPLVEAIVGRGVAVVSTTEELAYPWRANGPLARRLDAAARRAGVAVAATGVNPGFAMDALPIALTAICERVDRVRVDRVQDAGIRRLPFQQKIGAGLTRAEFERRVAAGTVRHVGLAESIGMIADAFGWRLDRVTDEIRPKIAGRPVRSAFLEVARGRVCGLVQDGVGFCDGEPRIVLHMEAYLGAKESFDTITVEGSPALCVKARGGYHGDIATASIAVNTIPKVLAAVPGLHTMRTLALPSFAGAHPPR